MENNDSNPVHFVKPKLQQQISNASKLQLVGKAYTRRGKKLQVLRARGAFLFLPVRFSNDIEHGSWWYVAGSLFSVPMAIVPLVDVFHPFFQEPPETSLKSFGQSATWIILTIIGVMYTFGSWVLVRAFQEPTPAPLLKDWKHFCTDELLAAWVFLLAALPAPIFCLVFIAQSPSDGTNWAMLFGSFLLIATSAWFVYVAYPSRHHMIENVKPHVLPIVVTLWGHDSWLCRHVATDWLASVWFFLIASLIFMFGSFILIIESTNDRQLFIWISSYFDFLMFAIGSAYLVAGSYPRQDADRIEDYDKEAEKEDVYLYDSVFNPIFTANTITTTENNQLCHETIDNTSFDRDTESDTNVHKTNIQQQRLQQARDQHVNELINKYSRVREDGTYSPSQNVSPNHSPEQTRNSSPIHNQINTNNFNNGSSSSFISTSTSNNNITRIDNNKNIHSSLLQSTLKLSTDETSHSSVSLSSHSPGLSGITNTPHGSSFLRSSKLKHMFGLQPKIESTFHNLRVSSISGDQNFIKCNHLYLAFGVERAGGGAFTVLNLTNYRRYDGDLPVISGHSAPVLDFDFNPFFHHMIATSSEDCTVKIWSIPEGGLAKVVNNNISSGSINKNINMIRNRGNSSATDLISASVTLTGHQRKVSGVRFHPSVSQLLASVSADGSAKLWNYELNKSYYSINPSISSTASLTSGYDSQQLSHTINTFYDHIWNENGSLLITSMKDRSVHFIDSRTAHISTSISDVHEGGKCIKLVSLSSVNSTHDIIMTLGNTKGSMRQCKIWDTRSSKTEVYKLDLDNSSGTIMPFYDKYLGILYLAGKGDGNIRTYELKPDTTELYPLTEFKTNVATRGMVMVPRHALDWSKCEVSRLLKLTVSSVDPISFYVPRKSSGFHIDLYPDVYGNIPPHNIDQWFKGSNLLPNKISSCPEATISITDMQLPHHSQTLSPIHSPQSRSSTIGNTVIPVTISTNVSNSNSNINRATSVKNIDQTKFNSFLQNSNKTHTSLNTQNKYDEPNTIDALNAKLIRAKKRIFELESRCAKAGIVLPKITKLQ